MVAVWKCGATMKLFNLERLMMNLFPPDLFWGPRRLLTGSTVVLELFRLRFYVGALRLLGLDLGKVFRLRGLLRTVEMALTTRYSGSLCEQFLLENLVLLSALL